MSQVREKDSGASYEPFRVLQEQFGFVPGVFRAQTLLPAVIEAEVKLLEAVLFKNVALSRIQKECILLVVSAANADRYGVALHYQMLRLLSVPEPRLDEILAGPREARLAPINAALVGFALSLATHTGTLAPEDLSTHGLGDDAILETILAAALGNFFSTLTAGLGVEPDFPSRPFAEVEPPPSGGVGAPLLEAAGNGKIESQTLEVIRARFGFVPAVFRAQASRADVLEAQAGLMRCLPRPGPLLQGLTDLQTIEATAAMAFEHFLATIQFALGAGADLPLRDFRRPIEKKVHLATPDDRHTHVTVPADPDAECVARVRGGDLNAFEELMNRHSQRVYRTLLGLLGDSDEARDAMQDTFLKAFQHLGSFAGRSKFSTWLTTIASNTAIQRLRDKKPVESLDESAFETEDGFRPRQVQAWTENPEQLYSQAEIRTLVQTSILRLPAKYRVVLMLRDIEQLSIEDSASALGLGIPAVKARLLRGRLMLREALAPHFISAAAGGAKGVAP